MTEFQTNREDIRVGYQTAVQLMAYEGNLSWQPTSVFVMFIALVVAVAIFPSFIGSSEPKLVTVVGLIFSVLGFTVSIMWGSMVARTRKYYQYWAYTARELEQLLDGRVQTLQRGCRFAEGNEVSVDNSNLMFTTIERIKMKSNFKLFYGTFTLSFGILIILNLIRLIKVF